MAKYNITRTCGHTTVEQVYGKVADRQGRADWMATKPCLDCVRAQERTVAAEAAASRHLPTLEGSDKQVAWALTIRERIAAEFDAVPAAPGREADLDALKANELAHPDASWWINNRHRSGIELLRAAEQAR